MKSRLRRIGLIAAVLFFLFTAAPAWALTVTDVAKEFICNCGCNWMLNNCEMTCGKQLRGLIKQKIALGWGKPKIVNYLITQYGEKVLAAPTKKGFNLTAWITPFVALALGGLFVYVVATKWAKQGELLASGARASSGKPVLDPEYERKLNEELEKFEF